MLRKAQISIEYLILMGFILLVVIIPGVIFLSSYANQGVHGTVNTQKVMDLGNGLVDNAKQIYYLGLYSKKIVVFDIPENVEDFFIVKLTTGSKDYYYISIILSDGKQVAKHFFPSDVPLMAEPGADPNKDYIEQDPTKSNYIPECTAAGASCSIYNFKDAVLRPGKKRFKMETKYDPSNTNNDIKVNIIPLIKD